MNNKKIKKKNLILKCLFVIGLIFVGITAIIATVVSVNDSNLNVDNEFTPNTSFYDGNQAYITDYSLLENTTDI